MRNEIWEIEKMRKGTMVLEVLGVNVLIQFLLNLQPRHLSHPKNPSIRLDIDNSSG
jgi:hypothetical protein